MSQTKIKNKNTNSNSHKPVLLDDVIEYLKPQKGERYLDLTAGYGGHSSSILDITMSDAVLIDRDRNAISYLNDKFGIGDRVRVVHADFLQACKDLVAQSEKFDLILADLGVSSPHLDNVKRGFSLKLDGPLDMRMDDRQSLDASEVVNTYSAQKLEKIIREYGEEPKARRMAELIVQSRPLTSTEELTGIAKRVWPGHSRTHPATRLFQAIRLEVNAELQQIEQVLPLMVDLLNPGGRMAVITFHSLEDRIVKRFIRGESGDRYDAVLTDETPKPVGPSQNETVNNPRSRSAKMRVAKRK